MAQYFQLTKKGETETTPFVDIDVDLWRHFGQPVDEGRYKARPSR